MHAKARFSLFSLSYLVLAAVILVACAAPPSSPAGTQPVETQASLPEDTEAPLPEETEPPAPEATETLIPTAEEVVETSAMRVVYLGIDGNVWVLDAPGGEARQVTTDARALPMDGSPPDSETIIYYFPTISSDGALVAYRRDAGTPVESGLEFTFGLWVTDLSTGESMQVYDRNPAGFAWKPGTHLLAYGQGVPEEYFAIRGDIDESLATGLTGIDLDTGESSQLVGPEGGYALYLPAWSPDGRFLSFDELAYYEGRGNFAYYDFDTQEYVAWDEPIGLYDWSPDGEQVTYDRLTYTATGQERIFLRDRQGGEERLFSPEFGQGYAFYPVFSPQGDRIAYFANLGALDEPFYTLFVQSLADGEPHELGQFESVQSPGWSPDGSRLVFSTGPSGTQVIVAVNVSDGGTTFLVEGSDPEVAGR